MVKFNYRLISLDLDYCQKMHGYWLDQGEADRVLQIMAKNNQDLDQKLLAENEWAQHLEQLRHPSFFSRLIDSLKQAISK